MLDWRIYKEGQGVWARNSVAAAIAILAVIAASRLFESLPDPASVAEISRTVWERWFKVSGWPLDYRPIVAAPVLLALMIFGFWQYNHPRWADFLIDTENELKNRVTWPSRRELITSSVVVVVAVILIGGYTFAVDNLFRFVFEVAVYREPSP